MKYKYNLEIDSFCVSKYIINNIEYYGENQPLLLQSIDFDNNLTDIMLIENSVSSIQKMMSELISKLTFPEGIAIV